MNGRLKLTFQRVVITFKMSAECILESYETYKLLERSLKQGLSSFMSTNLTLKGKMSIFLFSKCQSIFGAFL